MQKDAAEFYEWEEEMVKLRNEGTFFKGLYTTQFPKEKKKKKKKGDDDQQGKAAKG